MISIEDANQRISGLTGTEIRELTRNRLLGIDSTPFGSGHSSEPTEDIVIQLLCDPKPEEDTRKAVIMGCKDVYASLLAWLVSTDFEENAATWQDIVIRISRVVDVAAPLELMGHASSVLAFTLVVVSDKMPEVLGAAVRACMAYKNKSMLAMWKSIIDEHPDVAAYAFNALLNIEPNSPEVDQYLTTLWKRQVVDKWPVDTAFLMRRCARLRGEEDLVYRIMLSLEHKNYWRQVTGELLQKPWSADWLKKFRGWKLSRDLNFGEVEIRAASGKTVKGYPDSVQMIYKEGIGPGGYYQFALWKSRYFDTSLQERIRKNVFEMGEKEISGEREAIELPEEIQNV